MIHEIPVSEEDRERYIKPLTREDQEAGWRLGTFKCIFEGCTSNSVEPARVGTHLALHLYARKAHQCSWQVVTSPLGVTSAHELYPHFISFE